MMRIKLYIEGFRGPWGWVPHYEKYLMDIQHLNNIEPTTHVENADIIFQCDPTNWNRNCKYLGKKIVVANVLDFADWYDGTPSKEIESYVKDFCKNANVVTAISKDVIGKLLDYGINAEMFYYPSQVDDKIIQQIQNIPKQRRFISFCRLGDPGKRIELAVRSFLNSGLTNRGWEYFLIGPEPPRFVWEKHPSIKVFPYMEKETLYSLVASSMATIMPSDGEGLGLPAIESLLVNTIPIARNKKPMSEVLENLAKFFDTDGDLMVAMLEIEEEFNNNTLPMSYICNLGKIQNWQQNKAFSVLNEELLKWHKENCK